MTPEQQAVIDAAKAMADAWKGNLPEDLCFEEKALIDAVRALTPPLPPEPEDGAVVIARRDTGDEVYQRTDSDEFSAEHRWYMAGEEHPRTWKTVCAGSEVVLMLPVPVDLVPMELAREAAEAIRAHVDGICAAEHQAEDCRELAFAHSSHCVYFNGLLARLDAATGGAR